MTKRTTVAKPKGTKKATTSKKTTKKAVKSTTSASAAVKKTRKVSTEKKTSQVNTNDYWFAPKSYGWGWGLPIKWQGWAVLIGYVSVLAVGSFTLLPTNEEEITTRQVVIYYLFLAAITGALIIIGYKKGPAPKWRWGNKDK